jgi:hypothetical protein
MAPPRFPEACEGFRSPLRRRLLPIADKIIEKLVHVSPVIGFLGTGSPGALQELLAAFHRGLGEMGYIEGQNIKIEYRFAPKASTTDYRRWRLS